MTRSERSIFGHGDYQQEVSTKERTKGDEKADVSTLQEGEAGWDYPRMMDGTVDEGSIAVHTEVTVEFEDRDEDDLEAARGYGRGCRKGC